MTGSRRGWMVGGFRETGGASGGVRTEFSLDTDFLGIRQRLRTRSRPMIASSPVEEK